MMRKNLGASDTTVVVPLRVRATAVPRGLAYFDHFSFVLCYNSL